MSAAKNSKRLAMIREEWPFLVGAATAALFALFGDVWLADLTSQIRYFVLFLWLFLVILCAAFRVVHHAESLAEILGEPYGTLILTLSVITIEVVMIAAVMLTGDDNPALARDTMLSVLMIVLNGMVGVTLLVGGLRHHEQTYNLQGVNAYLAVILPLAVLGLILPKYTESTPDASASPLLAGFLILMSAGLYAVFLAIQTVRHSEFFRQPLEAESDEYPDEQRNHHLESNTRSISFHAIFLILTMLPAVILSKMLGTLINYGIEVLGAPQALGGFLVAILVLSPEGLSAIRSALANRLQRTINLCLGSALSTIGLTIPAVLGIGLITAKTVAMGLDNADMVLLLLTLLTSMVTFGSGRTNILQGAVHLLLFVGYVVLIFD